MSREYRPPVPSPAELAAVIDATVARIAAEDAAAAETAAAQVVKKQRQISEENRAKKEKRLLKLVGAVVVKCMSEYQKSLERDIFKKHAKEVPRFSPVRGLLNH
jgi:histone-lysine N-methyltransferase SETD2